MRAPEPGAKQVQEGAPPSLPVNGATLEALSELRAFLDDAGRLDAVTALLSTLPQKPVADSESVKYCLRRLALGSSVSTGGSRANMSLALGALARVLGASGPAAVLSAVLAVYGPKGSFVCDYAGAEREKALGSLAAGAAAARAARMQGAGAIDLAAARGLVEILRATAACQWGLGVSCALVARDVVEAVSVDERAPLSRTLLSWCRERQKSVDAAALALLLLVDAKSVSTEQFCELYPRPEILRDALMDSFQTGFPLWRRGEDIHCPVQWALTLRLVSAGGAKKAVGGVGAEAFWENFVVPGLCKHGAGPEKSTLALVLLPEIVSSCTHLESLKGILTDDLASFLRLVLGGRMGGKKRKIDGGPANRLHLVAAQLGKKVIASLRGRQRHGVKNIGSWVKSLVLWTMKTRLTSKIFKGDCMQSLLSLLSESDCDSLFRDCVSLFAQPQCSAREVGPIRATIVHFMGSYGMERAKLLPDVAKFLALYAAFDCYEEVDASSLYPEEKRRKGATSAKHASKLQISALLRNVSKDSLAGVLSSLTFAGLAPAASPEIAPEMKETLFRQLMDIVSWSQKVPSKLVNMAESDKTPRSSLPESVLEFLNLLQSEREKRFVVVHCNVAELKPALSSVAGALQQLPENVSSRPIARSIQVLLQFMELYMYDPAQVDAVGDAPASHVTYSRIIALLEPCVATLHEESTSKDMEFGKLTKGKSAVKKRETSDSKSSNDGGDESDGESEREPTALEQVVFILATLCRQHSSSMRQIAGFAFEIVAELADPSVSAVLFDLLEGDGEEPQKAESEADDTDMDEGDDSSDDEKDAITSSDEKESPLPSVKSRSSGNDKDASADEESSEDSDESVTPEDGQESAGEQTAADPVDDENEIDVDVMLDDEDPKVLEMYDKHLARHMELLKVEKKQNKRKRQSAARRALGAGRILDLVELLSRRMRLQVETQEELSGGTLFAFMDLLVRFVEFSYGPDSQGSNHAPRLASIFAKHLDRPLSSFGEARLDEKESIDLLARCFETLRDADLQRKPGAPETRMIAHACTVLVHVSPKSEAMSKSVCESYKMLWGRFCSPKSRLLGTPVFTSAASRVTCLLPVLGELAAATAVDAKATGGTRKLALEVLHSYIPSVRERSCLDGRDSATRFWTAVKGLLEKAVEDSKEGSNMVWKHGVNVAEFLRLLDAGMRSGDLRDHVDVGPLVEEFLSQLTVPRLVEKKWKKTLNSIYAISPPSAGGESAVVKGADPKTGKASVSTSKKGYSVARRKAIEAVAARSKVEEL